MSIGVQRPFSGLLHVSDIGKLGWKKALLICGIASSLLWVGMDVAASLAYDGYSYADQTVSELSAVGAPTRSFWMVFGTFWNFLVIGFAVGVWQSAGRKGALRVVAGLLIANAIILLTVGPFSSMHQREVLAADGATLSDTLHLVVVGVGMLTFFLEIGFAATALGRPFRIYSIATVLAMLVFGFLTSLEAPDVQDNASTPWIGITERINAYGYMLWIALLAAILLRRPAPGEVHS